MAMLRVSDHTHKILTRASQATQGKMSMGAVADHVVDQWDKSGGQLVIETAVKTKGPKPK